MPGNSSEHRREVRVNSEPERNLLKRDASRALLAPDSLAVVLFAGDVAGCAILRRMQFRSFLFRDYAVRLGFVLHFVDVSLLVVQSIRLAIGQLPAGETAIDPLFLIGLTLVDDRSVGLSIGH